MHQTVVQHLNTGCQGFIFGHKDESVPLRFSYIQIISLPAPTTQHVSSVTTWQSWQRTKHCFALFPAWRSTGWCPLLLVENGSVQLVCEHHPFTESSRGYSDRALHLWKLVLSRFYYHEIQGSIGSNSFSINRFRRWEGTNGHLSNEKTFLLYNVGASKVLESTKLSLRKPATGSTLTNNTPIPIRYKILLKAAGIVNAMPQEPVTIQITTSKGKGDSIQGRKW